MQRIVPNVLNVSNAWNEKCFTCFKWSKCSKISKYRKKSKSQKKSPNFTVTWRVKVIYSSMSKCIIWTVLLFISSTHFWFNAEQLSATLVPHWNIIGYRPLCFNWLNVESAQRVGRVASDKGPLFNNQDSFMGFFM